MTQTSYEPDFLDNIIGAFKVLFSRQHQEMRTVLRQPTPIKISVSVPSDGTGTIGGGFGNPHPVEMWQCPISHEAWINRITITSPTGPPKTGITTGQVQCLTSTGFSVFYLPILVGQQIAPLNLVTEGRLSAPHLNPGERLSLIADTLPASTVLRFDMQIVLVSGISPDTPDVKKNRVLETIVESSVEAL